ncbi:MAG: hypothetical protein HY700_14720 [Gemmatimonadetes bacterium]|nr:hypothetical protein [Gemmatimonadota bacterium]
MSWRVRLPILSLSGFLILPGQPKPAPSPVTPAGAVCRAPAALGNEIVDLQPTGSVATASGTIELKPLMSPFGVSVTPDGRYIFDATINVKNLPEPSSLGPYTVWLVWVATPSLDKIQNLGVIKPGQPVTARVDFTKMMYIVSAEQTAKLDRFKGQLVLVGRSASARVQNLAGCDIYDEQSRMGG